MNPAIGEALSTAARQTLAEAREHKRESRRHRSLARERMEAYDRLRIICGTLGIRLEIEGEGETHGRQTDS